MRRFDRATTGFCIAMALHVFQIPIILIQTARQLPADLTGPWAGFGVLYYLFTSSLSIGVTQLFYLAPVMMLLSLIKWRATLKGVCIAGLVTTLANIWFMLRMATPSLGSYAGY